MTEPNYLTDEEKERRINEFRQQREVLIAEFQANGFTREQAEFLIYKLKIPI